MNVKALVVTALAAAIAVGLWFAFARGADAAPEIPAAGPPAATAGIGGAAAATAAASPIAAGTGANERQAVSPPPTPAPAGAEVQVRGRLVDGKGNPRVGARLRLPTWKSPDAVDGIEDLPVPIDDARLGQAPATATDAEGRFTFAVGRDRSGRVVLEGVDLVFVGSEPTFRGARGDVDLGDLRTLRACSIAGEVRDPRGQPVADVTVACGLAGLLLGRSSARTDAAGRFEVGGLRAGPTQLRTASAKFLPAMLDVELADEERRTGVVLQVGEGQAIAGQVVDDRGVGVAGIRVGARRRFERAGVTTEQFTPDEATQTDANGYFVLSGLQGAQATVRAWGPGHTTATERNVAVGAGDVLLRVQRHGSVEGVLLGVEGQPIAGSRVSASARPAGAADAGEEVVVHADDLDLPLPDRAPQAITAADGAFRIDGVTPGAVVVSARGKSHRPADRRDVAVQPAQVTRGVRLLAERGATARVKVTDDAGKPVADATVRITTKKHPESGTGTGFRGRRALAADDNGDVQLIGDPRTLGSGTTGGDGVAEIMGLPAGPATVTATHGELAEPRPTDLALPASGVVDAALAMRRPGWVEITVAAAAGASTGGARYVVHGPIGVGEDERDRPGAVDASGIGRIGPLPPGDYWAELQIEPKPRTMGNGMAFSTGEQRGLSQTRQRFLVTAGETVRVQLRKPVLTRVHGTVLGAEGPAAGCEVELVALPSDQASGDEGINELGAPSARTGADGRFELTEVEAGRYSLRWGRPEQIVKARKTIEVMPDQAELREELDLRVGKLRVQAWSLAAGEGIEGAEVELIAGGADGAPPRQARRVMMVTMTMNSEGGGESSSITMGDRSSKTDADGVAEIADVPPGTYTVRITHDKHVAKEIPGQVVVEGQTTDAGRAEMATAGRLRVRVVAADGKPIGMSMVSLRKVGDPGEPRRQPAMGGQAMFPGLAPGRYAAKAQSLVIGPDAGPQDFGPETEVDVAAGRTPATVEVQVPGK